MDRTQTCETGGTGLSESIDRACSLLANDRRRRLLRTLVERDDDVFRFSELVTTLAAREADSRETIAAELYHSHLPKVAGAGVIEYDRRSGDVRYRGDEIVEAILDP